jgi:hypothetical protein
VTTGGDGEAAGNRLALAMQIMVGPTHGAAHFADAEPIATGDN